MSLEGPGVVMLSAGFYPRLGGAEKQALELSKALVQRGVRVTVLTRRFPGLARADSVSGIPVRRAAAWGGGLLNSVVFMLSSFWVLVQKARSYEVIHVHLAGSAALSACAAGRILGKGVVIKLGGGRGIGEIAASRRTWAGRLKLRFLRRLKPQFVAVTRDLIPELGEAGLSKGARVIPNGVDVRKYRPEPPEEKARLRAELGWPAGLALLYAGRLSAEKRLGEFLEALSTCLKESRAQAFFVLAGAGPEESALRARAARLGLESRVFFLPPTDRIERVYAASDVFVLPSLSEGLSNALLEALASGLAVLASRVGGTPEAVEDGRSGLLFDPASEGEMSAQLLKFLRAPELAGRMGAAARMRAVENFSIEKTAELYANLYADLRTGCA